MKVLHQNLSHVVLFFFLLLSLISSANAAGKPHVYIDRAGLQFYVMDQNGNVLFKAPCGIGKGGLKQKKNMSDSVTPTGEFTVDLILYENNSFDDILKSSADRYSKQKKYFGLISSPDGLSKLFQNMNSLDFNSDGKPDNAYGSGYLGLDSRTSITGPKMQEYKNTPYWFSIAIHGTPDEKNVGKMNSGGCVHLKKADLSKLIETGFIKIGTKVIIGDVEPGK